MKEFFEQLYIRRISPSGTVHPLRRLIGFERLRDLAPGDRRQAVFTVKALDASGAPAKSGRVKWTLNNFGAKVFASGEEDLSANGGTFTVKGAQTEPGFLRLDVTEVGKKPSSAKSSAI